MAAKDEATAGDPKLAKLRELMAKANGSKGVQAYIIPTEDPHMSEYPPDCFKRREYLPNFTGSAGTAVVTVDKALLWTDGRYFLQAAQELGPEWTLMKGGTGECPEIPEWLSEVLPAGAKVGFDPFCHTVDNIRKLSAALEASGKHVVPLVSDGNLVDGVWGEAQPPLPTAPLRLHPLEWSGKSVTDKLVALRHSTSGSGAEVALVTMLDEVAWLVNCRGSDVDYNPVFVSYGMVTPEAAILYTDGSRVPEQVLAALKAEGVEVKPYDALIGDVKAQAAAGAKIAMDVTKVSHAVYQAVLDGAAAGGSGRGKKRTADGARKKGGAAAAKATKNTDPADLVVEVSSPIVSAKSIKNDAELAGMKEAHLRDAVALCDFICWMEEQIASGRTLSEVEVDAELTGRRKQQQGFLEPSFATIAGANGNGAIIHYRAQEETCKHVDGNTLLLLDSGGQYDCGTTDITRTFHFGTPSPHQSACYTRVLQGHIGLDRVIFPEGTPGAAIDALARLPLWQQGLNYRHGTGHGVGAALNVHEGPQSISTRYWIDTPLAAGMVCSNEPGYYEDGGFGVRIENLVTVQEANTEFRYGGVAFLGFKPLTLVPIQTKMINPDLMSPEEVAWLDNYHDKVWEAVSPRLERKPQVLEWLKRNTAPLKEQKAAAAGAGAPAAAAASELVPAA